MKNTELQIELLKNGYNQSTFAKKMGVQNSFVSEVVNKKRNLDDRECKMWAKALKCEVSDIFGG